MIPFNLPFRAPKEVEYIGEALAGPFRNGSGAFTHRATSRMREDLGNPAVFLTQSCTAALELAALLSGIGVGDEVIMPSFTFVSTASAFVLRGAVPVFVDVDARTQNLDPQLVENAITERTRAIVLVHYAGIANEIRAFQALAKRANLLLIEDAAQAYCSSWDGGPLGTFGDLAAFSFHDSKNISCGEGGALVVNRAELAQRAEVLWEKGTNRAAFVTGKVDKYTWVDVGSSFLPSEITAAMLLAHLEAAPAITQKRRAVWDRYDAILAPRLSETMPHIARSFCPQEAQHNGHLYYLILPSLEDRKRFIAEMRERGISTVFHYVPLHSSPAGLKFGRAIGPMDNTNRAGECLIRLPLFADLELSVADRIAETTFDVLRRMGV